MIWVVDNTLVATAMAAVVWATVRWGKVRPGIAHVLWLLVIIKLIAPPLYSWSWLARGPVPVVDDATVEQLALASLARMASAPGVPVEASRQIPWAWVVFAVWSAGACWMVLRTMIAHARFQRVLDGARTGGPRRQGSVREMAGRLGVAVPTVAIATPLSSPFVCGVLRPTLIWPAELAMDSRAGRAVLAHELAHLRRRDHWTAAFEAVAAVVLWWHPLFWLARSRMRQEAELACDAWAIRAEPRARRDYAAALIDSLEREVRAVPGLAAMGSGGRARRVFERRLNMILQRKSGRLARWSLAPMALVGAALLAGPSLAQDPDRPRSEPTLEERIEAAVRRILEQHGKTGGNRVEVRIVNEEPEIEEIEEPEEPEEIEEVEEIEEEWEEPEFEWDDDDEEEELEEVLEELIEEEVEELVEDVLRGRHGGELRGRITERVEAIHELVDRVVEGARDDGRYEIDLDDLDLDEMDLDEMDLDEMDLGDLGLGRDVEALVVSLRDGEGAGRTLRGLVRGSLSVGAEEARREIRANPELRRLGLDDEVAGIVGSLLEGRGEFGENLHGLIDEAVKHGLSEARREIRADPELRRLNIHGDVAEIVGSLTEGDGDLGASLGRLIEKSVAHGISEVPQARVRGDVKGLLRALRQNPDDVQGAVRRLIEGLEHERDDDADDDDDVEDVVEKRRSAKRGRVM